MQHCSKIVVLSTTRPTQSSLCLMGYHPGKEAGASEPTRILFLHSDVGSEFADGPRRATIDTAVSAVDERIG